MQSNNVTNKTYLSREQILSIPNQFVPYNYKLQNGPKIFAKAIKKIKKQVEVESSNQGNETTVQSPLQNQSTEQFQNLSQNQLTDQLNDIQGDNQTDSSFEVMEEFYLM